MKAYLVFTGSGPLTILTSHSAVTNPVLLEKLAAKGIKKFVACEVDVTMARERYGNHFDVVVRDLHETDDLRVLDYNGHRAFEMFEFHELGEMVTYSASRARRYGLTPAR